MLTSILGPVENSVTFGEPMTAEEDRVRMWEAEANKAKRLKQICFSVLIQAGTSAGSNHMLKLFTRKLSL